MNGIALIIAAALSFGLGALGLLLWTLNSGHMTISKVLPNAFLLTIKKIRGDFKSLQSVSQIVGVENDRLAPGMTYRRRSLSVCVLVDYSRVCRCATGWRGIAASASRSSTAFARPAHKTTPAAQSNADIVRSAAF